MSGVAHGSAGGYSASAFQLRHDGISFLGSLYTHAARPVSSESGSSHVKEK